MAKEIRELIEHCKTHNTGPKDAAIGMLAVIWDSQSKFCQCYNVSKNDVVDIWAKNNPTQVKHLKSASLEEQAYLCSTLYSSLLDENKQATLCCYFTPPFLANRLINQVFEYDTAKYSNATIADLSAGGGAFLLPVAKYLLSKYNHYTPIVKLKKLEAALIGVDICQELLELCSLYLSKLSFALIVETDYIPKWKLYCQNSLYINDIDRADIILCNPPYRKLTVEEHKEYKKSYHKVMNGNSNLYALFIQKAIELSKTDALIGFVTPSSLLTGVHFNKTRQFIRSKANVIGIDLMKGRSKYFNTVLQETILFFINKEGTDIDETRLYEIDSKGNEKNLGFINIPTGNKAWICHRSPTQLDKNVTELIYKKQHNLISLGFKVNIGSYVWNRDPSDKLQKAPSKKNHTDYFPVIYPEMICEYEFNFNKYRKKTNKARWIRPRGKALIKSMPSLVLKRTRASNCATPIMSALIDDSFIATHKCYVPENHVIYITHETNCQVALKTLSKLFASELMGYLHACVNSTNSLSKASLLNMPMPSRAKFESFNDRPICEIELIKELER